MTLFVGFVTLLVVKSIDKKYQLLSKVVQVTY